ncbi:hypothetical protein [Henriciella sp.]|uniref:hypothetical protein n=1 Tax=Henriciella sp. TaxID=1968823 RepID=UPI0025BD114B|nr:hypothetical protein [Henriciella sp.]
MKSSKRDYSRSSRPPTLRIVFAIFVCGMAASILVALIAAVGLFTGGFVLQLAGFDGSAALDNGEVLAGATMSLIMCAFNWFLFYMVLPVTWLVLAASIGTFPYRRILTRGPYLRWATIWGALLVGGVTASLTFSESVMAGIGALVTGAAVGALAGYVCGRLFLSSVKPQSHLAEHTADVF